MTPVEQAHFRILKALERNPDLTQRELAEQLGLSLGRTNFLVNALIEKGAIKMENFRRSDTKLKKIAYTLEVLEAAGSKWNFLPFRPGLVGGHCIGVAPYYLTHKAQEIGYHPDSSSPWRIPNSCKGCRRDSYLRQGAACALRREVPLGQGRSGWTPLNSTGHGPTTVFHRQAPLKIAIVINRGG